MTDELIDQHERHRIRTEFGEPLFVEAGAGTGKTTEMVSRIVGVVEAGLAPLSAIVAITFTEAAAGELRERVRHRLQRRLGETTGIPRESILVALGQIEDAPMQTIHGFANRLLQMYPTAVGLPPVFTVQDATQAGLTFDAQWRARMRHVFTSPEPGETDRLMQVAWALGADLRKLRSLARAFAENPHLLQDVQQPEFPEEWTSAVESLASDIDQVIGRQFECSIDDDRMVSLLNTDVASWLDRLRTALKSGDEIGVVEALRPAVPKGTRAGQAKNWPAGALADIREHLARLEDQRCAALAPLRKWAIAGVANVVAQAECDEQRHRIAQGQVQFQDLLVLANELLQNESVREAVAERYLFVFVDEFQDTDPLQTSLVQSLARPNEAGVQRLFTVGDPKQSIYRFRHADVGQYLSVRSAYAKSLASLSTNFRTLGGILQWIDGTFSSLLASAFDHEWVPLATGRVGKHEGGVHVFGGAAEKGVRSTQVRETEAIELASILQAAREERWLVHDDDGEVHPIGYGDMAVLLPTRRSLVNLERAFRQARIPYRVESRSLVWATQEVRDVISVLRAISDDADEHAIVAALRSPAFGCGDDELFDWRQSGGSWSTDVVDVRESVVAQSLAHLASLRERATFMQVPAIVRMVVSELHLYQSAFGRQRQRETWKRLRFVQEQSQAWFDDGGSGLHGFLRWVDEAQQSKASMLESVIPEADDDAVRVMTIHAAKGLEFPLAAVVGLGSLPNTNESVRVVWRHGKVPEVRIGNKADAWQTPDFDAAATWDEEQEQAERARLLYVAATRARDHLVIGLHRKADDRGRSLASMLAEASAGVPVLDPPKLGLVSETLQLPLATVDAVSERKRLREVEIGLQATIRDASQLSVLSATRIVQRMFDPGQVLPVPTADGFDNVDDLSFRLQMGSAVHAVLEVVALDAGLDDVRHFAQLVAKDMSLDAHVEGMVQAVTKALTSEPVRSAVQSGEYWREVPVSTCVDDVVVRGTIDLVYRRHDGLVVVDYKTESLLRQGHLAESVVRYRPQLLTYAYALEQQGVGDVVETALLFVPVGDEPAHYEVVETGERTTAMSAAVRSVR